MRSDKKLLRRFAPMAMAGLLCVLPEPVVNAAYTLQPVLTNRPDQTVTWGSRFSLSFLLNSDAANVHNSVIFQVGFSQPGLILESYAWSTPYTGLPPNDDCTPRLASLPIPLEADTLLDPHRPNFVDVEFSNVLLGGIFGTGSLVTMTLRVPENFGYVGPLFILTFPDALALGFHPVPTTAGQPFVLTIVSGESCDSPGSGDFDGGGAGPSDVPHFVDALLRGSPQDMCIGDMNQDGALTGRDLQPLVDAIVGS